jgi:lysozyme
MDSRTADFIKRWEGCRLKAYQDQGGVWTIGYGQTGRNIGPGTVWTQDQAEAALEHFLAALEQVVRALLEVPVSEDQFTALMSFAYNLGTAALGRSALLKKLNAGDVQGAAEEFIKWDMAAGKHNPGLANRRHAERALFLKK